MVRAGWFALVVSTLVWTTTLSTTASAQSGATSSSARSLHQQAQRAYAGGRYEEALSLWQGAFAIEPRAGIQYNLSQCFGRLGRLDEESAALRRYLDMLAEETPERLGDAQADSARQRLVAIDERLGRTGLELVGLTSDSVLFVDDRTQSAEGDRIRLAPGTHAIRIERAGYEPFRASVTIVQGASASLAIEYTPEAEVREVVVERREVVYQDGPAPRSYRGLGLGMAIAGGSTLAIGAALGTIGLVRARSEFSGPDGDQVVRRYGIPADVSFGVGGALAVAGVIVLIVDGGNDEEEPPVMPVIGAGVVGVRGTF